MLPVSWTILTTNSRSFQRGTVDSISQEAQKLPAVKVEDLTKDSSAPPESNQTSAARIWVPDFFDHSHCLTDCIFVALLPTETHSTSFERS